MAMLKECQECRFVFYGNRNICPKCYADWLMEIEEAEEYVGWEMGYDNKQVLGKIE